MRRRRSGQRHDHRATHLTRPTAAADTAAGGLYERLLGPGVRELAPVVRAVHVGSRDAHGVGTFEVRRLHRLAALVPRFGLPPAGSAVPVELMVTRHADHEVWERRFTDRALVSSQYRRDGVLIERVGWLELHFVLRVEHRALAFVSAGCGLRIGPWRIRIPRWCALRVSGSAAANADGRWLLVQFIIAVPMLGPFFSYRVDLEPAS